MKKIVVIVLLSVCFLNLSAQSIEFSGVIGYKGLQSYDGSDGHTGFQYTSGFSNLYAISISDIKIDTVRTHVKFSLNFSYNKATVIINNAELAGSYHTNADVQNYYIGFSIYPVNLKIKSKIEFCLGLESDFLLKNTAKGMYSSVRMGVYDTASSDLSAYIHFPDVSIGINACLGFRIDLKKNWAFIQRINFYLGLIGEFRGTVGDPSSPANRFLLEFAFRKKLY